MASPSPTPTGYFPLSSETPSPGDTASPGDFNAGGSAANSEAGASGSSSGIDLSRSAIIAIIVVVSVVVVFGVASTALFFVAKKREWKINESIRRSIKRVATALTPRRSEFPSSVKGGSRPTTPKRKSRNHKRLDDDDDKVPPTPGIPADLEKGLASAETKPAKSGK